MNSARIPVGISECLLGAPVRYDGGHKRSAFCADTLSPYFDFIPVCPEMAIGLGTPRETIQLRRNETGDIRLVTTRTGIDHTEAMHVFATDRSRQLAHVCGYIFTQRSPSCGIERIKLHDPDGRVEARNAVGLFAQRFRELNPLIPVEEDGRLNDVRLRENFVMRVFVLARWRERIAESMTARGLVDFHTDHKYLVMAHHPVSYRALGRIVAEAGRQPMASLAEVYIQTLMQALAKPATRRNHSNVLQHLAGYFRKVLSPAHRRSLQQTITRYAKGQVPLSVPLALLMHHLAEYPNPYLQRQVYLDPHPDELHLRNFL